MPNLRQAMMAAAGVSTGLEAGYLFGWGKGLSGQLGNDAAVSASSPLQIGDLTTWSAVSADGRFISGLPVEARATVGALKTDGTLWTWGGGFNGARASGDVIAKSSPVQVGSLTDWSSLFMHDEGGAAVKTGGTLWTWGSGEAGMLGNNTYPAPSQSSPIQIGSLTDWSKVGGGDTTLMALKTDGTLWSWGKGGNGQCGVGTEARISSPTQVGSLTDWVLPEGGFNHMAVVKADGTLWTWGSNENGRLGDGTTQPRSVPTQIGTDTDWAKVGCGMYCTFAVKTGGTLYAWGLNTYGNLGLGDVVHRSSPVQVGTSTDWAFARGGENYSIAVKTGGSLWTWGQSTFGESGRDIGNGVVASSPVQVGTDRHWGTTLTGLRQTVFAISG